MIATIIISYIFYFLFSFSLDLYPSAYGENEILKYVCFFPLQKSMKKEHFLWQLFNIENDVVKTTEELEADKRSREGVIKELENFEHEAGKKKKEHAKYLKEVMLREKKIAEKSIRLDKTVSVFSSSIFGVGFGN